MALDLQCTPRERHPDSVVMEVTTHNVPTSEYVQLLASLLPGGTPFYTSPPRQGDGALTKEELFEVPGLQPGVDYWMRAIWYGSTGVELERSNECKVATLGLTITKTTQPEGRRFDAPQMFVSTVTVRNQGTTAETANFSDQSPVFPPGTDRYVSSVATGGASGNTVHGRGDIADSLILPPGSSVTYTIHDTVLQDCIYENIATLGSQTVSGGQRLVAPPEFHPGISGIKQHRGGVYCRPFRTGC